MKRSTSLLMAGVVILMMVAQLPAVAQKDTTKGYVFKEEVRLAATPVKNQYRSSTCWSFGTISLIESELLRMGKGEYDLSEMYVVHYVYAEKGERYVRMHGTCNMAAGGASPDALYVLGKYGMVTEEAYSGKVIGEENHIHGEVDEVLATYVDAIVKNPNKKLTPVWKKGLKALIETYLGEIPAEFESNGKKFTPRTFAEKLDIKPDDYVQISSFSYVPLYKPFVMEVPDNWNYGQAWNVELDEMIQVIDYALDNGYTVVWAADISEKGFSHRNGVAIVPETSFQETAGMERSRWEQMTQKEKDDMLYSFKSPVKEKVITPEMRQAEFDNYLTTDDHGMHIVGRAKDQNGTKYYIVKNSWGTDNNPYGGYLYVSEAYVKLKTISIMLHEDGVPKKIRKELGL